MKLGPLFIGWRALDWDDLVDLGLDRAFKWQGFTIEFDGTEYRSGFILAVRPVVAR